MKFNGTDLGHISAHWGSIFEGIVLLKQKPESIFRRSSSFYEHWCRLKGNLLVLLRNEGVHSTCLVGVVLLERCSAKPVVYADVQNAFQLEFQCGDPPLLFAARSAEEASMWCKHISRAGLSELSVRRWQLREELRRITGKDPLDPLNSASASSPEPTYNTDEFNEAGLELQLSLLVENSSLARNTDCGFQIIISVSEPGGNNPWSIVAETEIQTKNCRTFLKTVKLSLGKVPKTSSVKFSLLEFKDLRSSVNRILADAETTAEALYNTSSLNLPLIIKSKGSNKILAADYLLVVQVLNYSQSVLDPSHLDIHSQRFRNVSENILTRTYVFPHALGENMRVVEFMGESRICFQFPIEYLKSLITREHLLYDSLMRVGVSDPTLECLRKERLMGMKGIIERYETCLRNTVDHSGPSFKPSTERRRADLDFVPTNLHANRIALLNSENKIISFHDIVSVGAFSCASGNFKNKGLFRTLIKGEKYDACIDELLNTSPAVAAALQSDKHVAGKAFQHLATGVIAVARMSGDLTGLNSRLQPSGQAEVLAQRLEKGMSALVEICKTTSIDESYLQDLQANFESLFQRIVKLATGDSLANAEIVVSESTCNEREADLQAINAASSHLQKALSRAWERIEECLWFEVLSSLAVVASTETASVGTNLYTVSSVWDSIHYRHYTALCQALTTAVTGLAMTMTRWTPMDWKQMVRCGVPLHFEGLLSCYGEEIGMLENWAWAIQSLKFCRVVIRPNSTPVAKGKEEQKEEEVVIMEEKATRTEDADGQNLIQVQILRHNEVVLTVPRSAWVQAPAECQARGRIVLSLHPFHFNVGINEQQTFAERLERVNLQSFINLNGLTSLRSYFDIYTRKFGAPRKTSTQQDVCDVLSSLQYELESNKSKPVEVLRLATEVSWALNALRFTSCKSAKDRTAMSVSLEQARWLTEVEGMHKDSFSPALKCLRSTGLRLSNVEKNSNTRKYSFSHFQILSFPRAYRPPMGTYSLHTQS